MALATLTGLDIGSASIRAVEVALAKDGPVIHSFGSVPLPDGAVVAGVMVDDKAVTAGLKELWTSHKFSNRDVVLGVTNQQVVVREIEVTNLPPKEMKQALPFQVRDILPIPLERALLDFYPLEYPGTKPTVRGLLIAAPKDAVLAAVRAVEAANLHVLRVDLSSFAALRAAAHVSEVAEAVIDIGARTTNIIVHVDGAPQIVRTVPRGGDDITALMASRLGVELAEAEALKRQTGLFNIGSPEVTEAVAEGIRPLISEVRSSLAYYPTIRPGDAVERIALVGGGSQLPGLVDELARKLRVTAYLSDPLQRVVDSRRGGRHDKLDLHRASAAVSIGLTLGAA
jgi:type IV pilus assembly protein PilM